MIITLTELKNLIKTKASDATLNAYIAAIEPLVIQYVNDKFLDSIVIRNSETISFADPIVTDLNALFIELGFRDDDLIYIDGSLSNNGYKRLVSLTETALTCTAESAIKTESAGLSIAISRANVPEPIKIGIAEWIKLFTSSSGDLKSQKIGKYSETYKDNSMGMPDSIKILLNEYKYKPINYS